MTLTERKHNPAITAILCYAMHTLRCTRIVAHVHDELIIECSPEVSLEAVCERTSSAACASVRQDSAF